MQSIHAALQFTQEHPEVTKDWYNVSKYLVSLTCSSLAELELLISKLEVSSLRFSVFREPDIDNVITAICIEPDKLTYKLTKKIPLLLKPTV